VSSTATIPILDTETLIACHDRSVKAEQNRLVTDEFLKMLDPKGVHVIGFNMWHTNYYGTEGIRAQVFCKVKRQRESVEVWIDFMPEDFNALEKVEAPQEA
jgi:hypothetical protein